MLTDIEPCRMKEIPLPKGSTFLQDGLIHRTGTGLAVRSKSELIIAEALNNAGIPFEYEEPLSLGGTNRYPDFTIEDEISGQTIYWEHLGMLEREDYRRNWEKKLAWYNAHGIEEMTDEQPRQQYLVTTKDSSTSGLDMAEVNKAIEIIQFA